MKILKTIQEIKDYRKQIGSSKVGFVPTMGALHPGHASLLEKGRKESDILILSIFVNPTQFNDPNDFKNYPITLDKDLEIARQCGVDAVFLPNHEMMYPDGYKYKVVENHLSPLLCGQDRPGHFDGVLTVVMKLFNLVSPHKAFFGEKDFQQLTLIKKMVDAFFMDLEIVPCATLREFDGLAMSSRNTRLSSEERAKAPAIYKAITNSKSASEAKAQLSDQGFKVHYVEDIEGRRFVAASLGAVRLIDNVKISI
jgi:pantoate--beta-alanine ligase